jgi:histone acetyltransferase (RNA polymerase elongator complex component)
MADLLRSTLLRDVVEDQNAQLNVVVHRVELKIAVLKADALRALLARGVERVEIGMQEWHDRTLHAGCGAWAYSRVQLR